MDQAPKLREAECQQECNCPYSAALEALSIVSAALATAQSAIERIIAPVPLHALHAVYPAATTVATKTSDSMPTPPPLTRSITAPESNTPSTEGIGHPTSDQRWYACTVGRATGVFQGSHNLPKLVSKVSGACVQRFGSEELARAAYAQALQEGAVHVVDDPVVRSPSLTIDTASP